MKMFVPLDALKHDDSVGASMADERRRDVVTSDIVQVGLMFTDVFGMEGGANYFNNINVTSAVARRVLSGRRRAA
jgi:hypothetical protein